MFGELELAQKESNRVQPVIAPINNDIMSHNT